MVGRAPPVGAAPHKGRPYSGSWGSDGGWRQGTLTLALSQRERGSEGEAMVRRTPSACGISPCKGERGSERDLAIELGRQVVEVGGDYVEGGVGG